MIQDPGSQVFVEPSEVTLMEAVGRGSFGVVYKAAFHNQIVAVKIIEADQNDEEVRKEVNQLSQLDHPNIIKLYGVSMMHSSPALLMEFSDCGSLQKVLHSQKEAHYTYAHAISWMLQCAKAMDYLHSMTPKALMHRDLKPLNMLMFQCGTTLKVCDFGTVCTAHTQMTHNKGSAPWMAPEVFQGSRYSEKCDVYSFGIIMWEIITRREPYDYMGTERRSYTILWQVSTGKRPPLIKGIPRVLENLMTTCWSEDPQERPAFKDIVKKLKHLYRFCNGANEPLQGFTDQTNLQEPEHQQVKPESTQCTIIDFYKFPGLEQVDYNLLPVLPMMQSKKSVRIYEQHAKKLQDYLELLDEIHSLKLLETDLDDKLNEAARNEDHTLHKIEELTKEKAKLLDLVKEMEYQVKLLNRNGVTDTGGDNNF